MTQTGFTVEDLYRYRALEELQCHPGLGHAAITVRQADRACDGYRSAIWLVPLHGGAPRQLTAGTGIDNTPRWSPDRQTLGFVSGRDATGLQVHVMRVDGGEARRVSAFEHGVVTFEWAPDGMRLLVIATMKVDPDARGQAGQARASAGVELAWRLPYKADGMGYVLDRETHLFTLDVDTGASRQLTHGPIDVRSAAWSPDGARIAYTCTRAGRQAHRTDLWVADADGAHARQLTRDVVSSQYPRWSPDGRRIAFSGGAIEGDSQIRPWQVDLDGDDARPIGDASFELAQGDQMFWTEDGSALVILAARSGRREVARLDPQDGALTSLVGGGRQVMAMALGDELVFTTASLTEPCELHAARRDGAGERRLTDFNAWWRERPSPRVEARTFGVDDGEGRRTRIDGWLVLPPGERKGPFPLVVEAHGGPQSYVDFEYARHVDWPVLWSRGYAILALNFVGSATYGRAFMRALQGRWGERDLPQHLAAIDALQREGVAGRDVAITGKSYGGFLAAYAIGHSDRFRAAIVSAPVANIVSHFGTSDSGYYVTPYAMGGESPRDRANWRRLSPVDVMHRVRTPVLFLQGKDDQRCPVGQSEELFATVMRETDTPAELALYPGASHHLPESGKPSQRIDYYGRVVAWIERWMPVRAQADGDAARAAAATLRVAGGS